MRLVNSFINDTRGSIIIMFAAGLTVMLLLIFGMLEFSASRADQAKLQGVIDAAVLAAAKDPDLTDAEREKIIEDFIKSQFPDGEVNVDSIDIDPETGGVKVSASQQRDTLFGNVSGQSVDRELLSIVEQAEDAAENSNATSTAQQREIAEEIIYSRYDPSEVSIVEFNVDPQTGAVDIKVRKADGDTTTDGFGGYFDNVNATSEAVIASTGELEIIFFIDNSISMSRPQDGGPLPEKDGCTFYCHTVREEIENLGFRTRLTALTEVMSDFGEKLKEQNNSRSEISFALYTFSRTFQEVQDFTNDLDQLEPAFKSYDFEVDTRPYASFKSMAELVEARVSENENDKRIMIFITDGKTHHVDHAPEPGPGIPFMPDDKKISGFSGVGEYCDRIKDTGTEIFAIHMGATDAGGLTNCASENGYHKGDNTEELIEALDAILRSLVKLHLTT